MEIKSIEQIIKEHAIECGNTFGGNIVAMDIQAVHVVCTRYAQQFQAPTDVLTTEIMVLREKNAELVEMLKSTKDLLEAYPSEAEMHLKATEIRELINSNITE